jgi:endoglucanase
MVNAHRTVANAWPGDGLWYDAHVTEQDAIESWQKLAAVLCKHWNAFAADIVNEPVHASWGRNSPKDWNKAAERIGNAVLQVCPRLLIFVQGVSGNPGAPNDGGEAQGYFWGENLVGARATPVKLRDMSKLVYSPHTYGPGVFPDQPYFPTCKGGGCKHQAPQFPKNMPAIWDNHFGFLADQSGHAIVVGEVGKLSHFVSLLTSPSASLPRVLLLSPRGPLLPATFDPACDTLLQPHLVSSRIPHLAVWRFLYRCRHAVAG